MSKHSLTCNQCIGLGTVCPTCTVLFLHKTADDLLDLVRDMADDAGYNLANPPQHYCRPNLQRGDERLCTTCDVHKRVKAVLT